MDDGMSREMDDGMSREMDDGMSREMDDGMSRKMDDGMSREMDDGMSRKMDDGIDSIEMDDGMHREMDDGIGSREIKGPHLSVSSCTPFQVILGRDFSSSADYSVAELITQKLSEWHLCTCLSVNQGVANRNRWTERLVTSHAENY